MNLIKKIYRSSKWIYTQVEKYGPVPAEKHSKSTGIDQRKISRNNAYIFQRDPVAGVFNLGMYII